MRQREPYFDKPGLSFHQLQDFRKSPRYYYRKHVQRILKDEDRPSYVLGRAVHCLTLEGKAAFDTRFVCVPPEYLTPSGAVSTSKDAKAWRDAQTCDILSPSDYDLVKVMAERVHENDLGMLDSGNAEVERLGMMAGIQVKGKADWICELDGVATVIDLKTCFSLDSFEDDAKKYGYDRQKAWYMRLFECPQHYLIAVENSEPHRVGMFRFGIDRIASANATIDLLLKEYSRCQLTDQWADWPSSITEIN